MARLYHQPPSRILRLSDPLTAWCVDEAIAQVLMELQSGAKLRPKKTENNVEMLRQMGVRIERLEE